MKRLILTLTAALGGLAVIPSVASAVTSPLVASPAAVNGGTTLTTAHDSWPITITNTGTDPVQLALGSAFSNSTGPNGLAWMVNYTSCSGTTLAPNDSCEVDVTPEATTPGIITANLILDGTDTITGAPVTQLAVPLKATLVAPPLHLRSSSVSRSSFYPLVLDGFQDATRYSATFNHPATGKVQVINRLGRVVKVWPFTNRTSVAVDWRGRNLLGTRVKPGTFRFRIVAHAGSSASSGKVNGGIRSVAVRTGWRAVHHRIDRLGVNYSSRSGSSCHWHIRNGTLVLDSWGGHCTATYNVGVPAKGYWVSWSMGTQADPWLDFGGPKSHTATRTASGVHFTATASDWAAMDVRAVHVSYWIKHRI